MDNYYLQFVPQVTAATTFFTYMTMLMFILCVVMAVAEWKTPFRWAPIVVLLSVLALTGLTVTVLLPLNAEMSRHITDPTRLRTVLNEWMPLNIVRVGLWSVQWLAMMLYFAFKALAAGVGNNR